jgi:hypothetical protein
MGGSTLLALAGGLSIGFTAGYVIAKGPEQTLKCLELVWAKLRGSDLPSHAAVPSPPHASAHINLKSKEGAASPFAAGKDRMSSGALAAADAAGGAAAAFENALVAEGSGLSPTSSLAGSVSVSSFSLPPTPLAGSRSNSDAGRSTAGRSSSGDRLKMVGAVHMYRLFHLTNHTAADFGSTCSERTLV